MNSSRILPAYHLFKETFVDMHEEQFELVLPFGVDRDLLLKAHAKDYVAAMDKLSRDGSGSAMEYGLGTGDCPVWKGMADASEFVVGSSVTSAEQVYNGTYNFSFVLLGGLHHARSNRASGFCYYNDINVAIHRLKELNPDIRILYFDSDLHHGDGTQFDFYNDPNVLTISFHESGQFLFPGTGFSNEIGTGAGEGYSINLPFFPYTWDEMYLYQVKKKLPALFESYQPDFVIWQAGVDGHQSDLLGHLQLTTNTYHQLGSMVRNLAYENMDRPQVLTLGGGGYNPDTVARSWAHIVAGLSNTKLPKRPSVEWVETCLDANIQVSDKMADTPSEAPDENPEVIIESNRFYDQEFEKHVSPHFSI